MDSSKDLDTALAELGKLDTQNFAAAAKKHRVDRTTLSRRFRGVTRSRQEAVSISKKLLTNSQEEVIINFINRQASRGLYLTSRLLKSMVEHFLGREINKNWPGDFLRRYTTEIKGVYLSGFDKSRHAAESAANTKHFFENVRNLRIVWLDLY